MCRRNGGRFTDQHIRKQGVQGAAGSVRTHNDRELEVQFGQKCPMLDAESSALLASETGVGQKSDLPSSVSGEDHALHAGFGASVHHTGKRRQQRKLCWAKGSLTPKKKRNGTSLLWT